MKILVTGGAGYIGSILVPELIKKGYKVTVIYNFMYKQNSLLEWLYSDNIEIVRGDVRDKDLMKKLVKDMDIIIPLAALVGAPLCDRDNIGAISTNLDAIKILIELLSKNQMIIFPTTNSGYGIGEEGVYCTEETPLKPISLYGKLKVEAENILLERGNVITYRLATVFGLSPKMRIDLLVNDFTYRAVTDKFIIIFEGHFKRNYIHIRDVARAFLFGIENFDNMKDEPYNVGLSNANLSKIELCEVIQKYIPDFIYLEAPIGEDPDKRNYIVSNDKIEKKGFKPIYSLDDGIKELIKGYTIITNRIYGNV